MNLEQFAMDRSIRRSRLHARSEDGAALIEFALVLPLLVLLLFAMLEFGKAFNYWIDETHLANEGARWAVVDHNPGSGTLQQYIKEQATTAELRDGGTTSVPNPAQVCISFPTGTSNVGDPVEVTVTATYNWLSVLGLGVTSTALTGRSTMRLEAEPTNYAAGCS
jgi:Flp pilus assembly protein TadG